jgi:Na+-transporting NADH:ubiquinone oxidoreductase subunit C
VAIEEDFNTIAGISMDHKAETPGLGAEIKDNPDDYNQPFVGKKLYDESGEYVSVAMKKGAITDPAHQVDAITGATITSDGVSKMLYEDVKAYLPYFQTLKNS